MLFERKKGIIRPKAPAIIAPAAKEDFMLHRRGVMEGFAWLLGGAALGAASPARASYVPQPPVYEANQNTLLQVFDPGVGSLNRTSPEDISFMNGEGLFVGPGNRPDATIIMNSPLNLFKRHKHVRFDQVQFSSTRPDQSLNWTAIGGGSFSIVAGSSGGELFLSTGTSNIGDGGSFTQDFNSIVLDSSTKIYFFLGPVTASSDQVILFGLKANSSNQVYFERSDIATDGGWLCFSTAGGVSSSFNTGVTSGLNRTIFCISYDGSNINFWIGSSNNTFILEYQTSVNVPTGQTMFPFLSYTTQSALVNRQLAISDIYTICNA